MKERRFPVPGERRGKRDWVDRRSGRVLDHEGSHVERIRLEHACQKDTRPRTILHVACAIKARSARDSRVDCRPWGFPNDGPLDALAHPKGWPLS